MKKVARLRIPQQEDCGVGAGGGGAEHVGVRTTGRIKKPKAVFDPSDNYLPRSQRLNSSVSPNAGISASTSSLSLERKRDTPTSQLQQLHDAQQNKRLSQSSNTSAGTTATTVASEGGTGSVDTCVVCQKREAKRGVWSKNKLIACLECPRKVHKLCLKMDFADMDVLRQNYKCENCRTCEVCDAFPDCDPKINQPMVTCSKCIKSYHLTCHIPNVFKYQQTFHWKCNKCQPSVGNGNMLPVKTIREIIGDEPVKLNRTTPHPQHAVNIAAAAAEAKTAAAKRSLQEAKNGDAPKTCAAANGSELDGNFGDGGSSSSSNDPIAQKKIKYANEDNNNTNVMHYSPYEPLDVPDVKDWSVDQVAAYFQKYFPREAHVFKEHEIDGTSLLLLKRSDVIKKLPIKLGPSLRIYSLILKIQTQLNDPTLGWNCGL